MLLGALGAADSLSDKQKELERLQAEIQRNQKLLQQTKIQENASLRDLSLLNRSIGRAKNDLDYNQKQLTQQAVVLRRLSTELEQSHGEYLRLQDATQARILEMYKTQDLGWLTLLLSNLSFSDLLESTHHYRRILARDLKNIRAIRALKKDIVNKKENLEYQKNIVESTKKSIEQQKALYEQRAKKQEQIAAALRAQRLAYERREDLLLKNSQEIEAMIKKIMLENPPVESRGSGKYIWPLKGTLTSYYGRRLHPIFKVWKSHTGLDIADGKTATPVKAADSGVVIYAEWYGGYGNAIIIDHGKGFSTLYGHLSKIGVRKNAKVDKGQVIGNVGSTGYATGPHLHFEIRRNGETVDPLTYLPPQ
ncbi:peptidase M23 [Candidatus Termititenax persephonae]|uniref:Peptidase M23 n=1 Tax=Candidatus Termititenax persephonae TaxID=2218525 RepID=A0A388TIM9_9BACT|nr:peptidase M23 [Candidatus Termititenax persephonae]